MDGGPDGLRLAEMVAMLTFGEDSAFGQPLGAQLRCCVIASAIGAELGLDAAELETVFWVALLRYLGCTGHAHEVAAVFGDDIATRSRSVVKDLTDPREILGEIVRHAGDGRPVPDRVGDVLAMLAGGRRYMVMNFRTACEVADALLERLAVPSAVRTALAHSFERYSGRGLPAGTRGSEIPIAMRIVHLAQDMEAIGRIRGHAEACDTALRRRGAAYDPDVVDAFRAVADVLEVVEEQDPWETALALQPDSRPLSDERIDAALLVAADFIDMKSPFTLGHSRSVAELSAGAARLLGCNDADVTTVRRAGWVHDLGRTGIPNSIWDKPGPLARAERDRVEMHPLLTDQMLRYCTGLAPLRPIAACHHERLDGSGYYKGLRDTAIGVSGRILAAADCYHAMTEPRAYRPAMSADAAAATLRGEVAAGRQDRDASEAVLQAAGHRRTGSRGRAYPDGLTGREVEVLAALAIGSTTKQIAADLVIAVKTADRHIQNIYAKIGVSTRGAAALYAVENDLVRR